ncbi:MAG: cobalamin-dependent protein [Candidatus Bathyarchaeota archaeon]|nr:MAG: cobalamin-dependent protein [Candidatus Bathyarchaeota archaeon]
MREKTLGKLREAVINGNIKKAKALAKQVIDEGVSTAAAIDVLMQAIRVVDKRYEAKEYFVTEVASSASAMREAFKLLEPYMEVETEMIKGRIVIGSLKGNIQSLGKDIVAATLQSAGFQVFDLGIDVPPEEFVDAAIHREAQIIAISISMQETIPYLKDVVDILKKKNLRSRMRIVIGGNAVNEQTCMNYELDAYAVDAKDTLEKVKMLLN